MSEHLVRCPNGHLGWVDDDQIAGDISIVCDNCEFHGYVDDVEIVEEGSES